MSELSGTERVLSHTDIDNNKAIAELLSGDNDDFDEDEDEGEEIDGTFEAPTSQCYPERRQLSPLFEEVSSQKESDIGSNCSYVHATELPSVVIRNSCGEDIVVSLYVNPSQPSAFTTCLAGARKMGSVVAPYGNTSRLYTPWTLLFDQYEGPVFPMVTFAMQIRDGHSYSASPAPLHSLSSRALFLTRQVSGKHDSDWSLTGNFIPAVVLNYEVI